MDPVAIALGLTSALSWGTADFAGGFVTRTLGSVFTAASSQAVAVVLLLVVVLSAAETAPVPAEAGWAVVAGIGGGIGLLTFYRALARGDMGLVAPLSGALGAGIPVIVSLALGERIGALQAAGVLCGLTAVVVVSMDVRRVPDRRLDLPLVIAAGVGFAVFFVAIDRASAAGGHVWTPLFIARVSSLALYLAMLLVGRRIPAGVLPRLPLIAFLGIGDLGGNVFFVLADARAPLSIAVVLSSLFPVVTAILAWLLLRERLRRVQLAGAALAVAAIVLLAS